MAHAADSPDAGLARRANVRTALTLASIAAVFFGGIIAAQYVGGSVAGAGAVGLGIIGLLLVALGRRARRSSRP